MHSVTVTVASSEGLHARPAAIIAETAESLDSDVEIALVDGEPVLAASAMLLMSLGADKGAEVVVSGPDAEDVEQIAALVARDLDAE